MKDRKVVCCRMRQNVVGAACAAATDKPVLLRATLRAPSAGILATGEICWDGTVINGRSSSGCTAATDKPVLLRATLRAHLPVFWRQGKCAGNDTVLNGRSASGCAAATDQLLLLWATLCAPPAGFSLTGETGCRCLYPGPGKGSWLGRTRIRLCAGDALLVMRRRFYRYMRFLASHGHNAISVAEACIG